MSPLATQRIAQTPRWATDELWRKARAVPSLDLRFADNKSLVDATTGQNLVTFSRASGGTYVDSQGVIRNATTNLLLRSEEFDNASWTTTGLTITANSTVSPAGTMTADTLLIGAGAAGLWPAQAVSITDGVAYTFSIYVNTAQTNNVTRLRVETAASSVSAFFTLSTRTWSFLGAGFANGSFQNLSNGWVRAWITYTPATGDGGSRRFSWTGVVAANGSTPDTGNTQILWGAQLEQSSTVGEYIPTTSTINSAPRFDHDPSTGESLGLLVEEARTNLLLRSEEFDNASWAGLTSNVTPTSNTTTAPNGTVTADTLDFTNASSYRFQTVSGLTAGTTYSFSVWLASATKSNIALRIAGTSTAGGGALLLNLTPTLTRYSLTVTLPSGNTAAWVGFENRTTDGGTGSTGTIIAWGAQLEAGAFPTSYVKTEAATATRAADVASITGANFSSWYRQDEGTVFAQVIKASEIGSSRFPRLWAISDGTGNNAINGQRYGAGTFRPSIAVGGVTQAAFDTSPAVAPGSSGKFALAVKQDDIAGVTNGGTVVTDTSATLPTVNQMHIGDIYTPLTTTNNNGAIARLTYWPQRLSNATLQSITR